MEPIYIFEMDDKYHSIIYCWSANGINVGGTMYKEVLYVDGKSYTNPKGIHELMEIDTSLLGTCGTIDFGWHKSLASLRQECADISHKLKKE